MWNEQIIPGDFYDPLSQVSQWWHCWRFGLGNCCGEGVCPMHCRVFNNIPTICPLDASSTPHTPHYDNQNISPDIAQCPQKGKLPAGWDPLPYALQLNFMTNALLPNSKLLRFFPHFFSDSRISLLNIFTQFPLSIMHSPSSAFP